MNRVNEMTRNVLYRERNRIFWCSAMLRRTELLQQRGNGFTIEVKSLLRVSELVSNSAKGNRMAANGIEEAKAPPIIG